MNCCQNNSSSGKIIQKERKVSWKTIITAAIILGLLIISLLSIMFH